MNNATEVKAKKEFKTKNEERLELEKQMRIFALRGGKIEKIPAIFKEIKIWKPVYAKDTFQHKND